MLFILLEKNLDFYGTMCHILNEEKLLERLDQAILAEHLCLDTQSSCWHTWLTNRTRNRVPSPALAHRRQLNKDYKDCKNCGISNHDWFKKNIPNPR